LVREDHRSIKQLHPKKLELFILGHKGKRRLIAFKLSFYFILVVFTNPEVAPYSLLAFNDVREGIWWMAWRRLQQHAVEQLQRCRVKLISIWQPNPVHCTRILISVVNLS